MSSRALRKVAVLPLMAALAACQSGRHAPMPTVDSVELGRFMGDWYVIANIPTRIERGAHNAVETYRLDDDGTIDTLFRFRAGAFDGPLKTWTPRGFVVDRQTNALWGMRFVWPIKADYRIVHLDADYTQTVVGREKRDYVWIMARTPQLPEADYARLVQVVADLGYDTARLQKVPQRWPEAQPRPPR